MTLARQLNNRMLREQTIRYDVPDRWRVDIAVARPLQTQNAYAQIISAPAIPVSVRVEHRSGDYTIVLGSVIAGPLHDPVEVDYSFLDD